MHADVGVRAAPEEGREVERERLQVQRKVEHVIEASLRNGSAQPFN